MYDHRTRVKCQVPADSLYTAESTEWIMFYKKKLFILKYSFIHLILVGAVNYV